MTCVLPFKQMVVRPDGKISLCCNDALGEYTVGDTTEKSLVEIWYSKEYNVIRHKICKGRKQISICSKCDSLFHPDSH